MRIRTLMPVAAGVGLLLALAAPLAASAHVTLVANTAAPGSSILLTFKVPTESATATTTGITIRLPQDTPFSSVRAVAVAGWTSKATTTTLPTPVTAANGGQQTEAVTEVSYTADSAAASIQQGELGLFTLQLSGVPNTGRIAIPVDQQYSDGSVVSWSEIQSGTAEPEHPAPVLYITDAPPAAAGMAGPSVAAAPAGAASGDGSDPIARGLGIAGLVVGAAGITAAVVRRRPEKQEQ